MEVVTLRLFVSGKVQGVSYRRFAQKKALALSLEGWTRNLKDGRVEIWVRGAENILNQYLLCLWQGPALAHVTDIQREIVENEEYEGFLILRDGD